MKNTMNKMIKLAKTLSKNDLDVFNNVASINGNAVVTNSSITFIDKVIETKDIKTIDYPIADCFDINEFKNLFSISNKAFKNFIENVGKYVYNAKENALIGEVGGVYDNAMVDDEGYIYASNGSCVFSLKMKIKKDFDFGNLQPISFTVDKLNTLRNVIDFTKDVVVGVNNDVICFDNGSQQISIKTNKDFAEGVANISKFIRNNSIYSTVFGYNYSDFNKKESILELTKIVKIIDNIDGLTNRISFSNGSIEYYNTISDYSIIDNFIDIVYDSKFNVNVKLMLRIIKSVNSKKINFKYKGEFDILEFSCNDIDSIKYYLMPMRL